MTIWAPDTCECRIEITNDTAEFVKMVSVCTVHEELETELDVWNTVMDENPRKNITLTEILQNAPEGLSKDVIQGTKTERVLNDDITYNFSYTGRAPNRKLVVSFSNIDIESKDKSDLQTKLNARFGNNKVELG